MNKFNILAGLVGILTVFTGYLFLSNQINSVVNVGTELPDAPALFETSLAAPITATADSFTLTANSVRGGGSLSGYNCFTIDEGSAQAEFVCGTASSTSVTGVTRGISPSDGTSAVSALQFAHRRGANVKITDFPIIQIIRNQNNGEATFENALSYAPGVTPTGGSDLADVDYVLSTIAGTSTLSYNRVIVNGTAGETFTTGAIVYLKASDSRWYKADNDLTETYVDQELGIAQGAGTSGNGISGGVLTYGLDSTQVGMTSGTYIFLSATAGATSTATTSQVLGKAISATTMFFDQNLIDSSVYIATTFSASTTFSATTTFTGATIGIGTASTTVFTTAGTSTYTLNPRAKYIIVELIGGGGGGGGGSAGSGVGGGGGGGAGIKKLILASALSATTTVTIGAGGAGAGVGGTGVTGGTTSFSAYSAVGGSGGTGGSGSSNGVGGAGGAASGGDYNFTSNSGSGQTGGTISAGIGVLNKGNGGNGGAASSGSGSAGQAGNVIITEYF